MRLVPNWKQAWRWHSVQILAVLTALPAVWMQLPADLKAYVPEAAQPWILTVIAFAALVGRVRQQGQPE